MATPIPSNEASFTLDEVLAITGGKSIGTRLTGNVKGVCTDTRHLVAGELFIALCGVHYDAHDHLQSAHDAAAGCLLLEREVEVPRGAKAILVPSTLAALAALATFHQRRWRRGSVPRSNAQRRVVAITGSAGKTTTKQAIAGVLAAVTGEGVHLSLGNLNNQIGVPLTLLGLEERHRYAVLELGTNAPGEIAALAAMVEPDVAVVTLIALAHTEGLGGIEEVAREKAALYASLDSRNGVAIGNLDDRRVRRAVAKHQGPVVGYGHRAMPLAGVVIEETRLDDSLAAKLVLRDPSGRCFSITTPLVGKAGALASAAALAVLAGLNIEVRDAASLTRGFRGILASGRLQLRRADDGLLVIDDSYNANPASMRSSIDFAAELARQHGRRLVLVLGEMRELGMLSGQLHREIGSRAAQAPASLVIGVGGDARLLVDSAAEAGVRCLFAVDAQEAAELIRRKLTADDLVLVKGSRGVGTEAVVESLLTPPRGPVGGGGYQQRCGSGTL